MAAASSAAKDLRLIPQIAALHLVTPCYGGMAHAAYMQGVLALEAACAERGLPLRFDIGGGEALIGRGRAAALAQFLRTDASHLLFVDADIGFAPSDVLRLLEAGREVIGGVYARKAPGAPPELEPLAEGLGREGDLARVASMGTGFMLIARSAAERISAAYPELRAKTGDVNAASVPEAVMVFDSFVEPETGRYLADHQAFCRRWRAIGGEVWADFGCRLSHFGEAAYVTG
jgi:hypothetical protein